MSNSSERDQGDSAPWPGEMADAFLVENGVYAQQSEHRARLLRCIGCLWERMARDGGFPEYTNQAIPQCTGVSDRTIGNLSRALQKANLVTVRTLPFDRSGRPVTHYYGPVDTAAEGTAFQDVLQAPRECGMDSKTTPEETT